MARCLLAFAFALLSASACALRTPLALGRRQITLAAAVSATNVLQFKPAIAADTSSTIAADGQLVVGGGEGAYKTISSAVAAARSGSTIIVRPGIYAERLILTHSVRLLADAGAVLDWKSTGPNEPALTVDLSSATSSCDVLVTGLVVKHFSDYFSQNYAVYVARPAPAADVGSHIELRGCEVSSGSGSGVGIEGGDFTLTESRVSGCKFHGVAFLGPTARGAVRKCVVEKCKQNGLLIRDGASPTIEANKLLANGQFGAALLDCRGLYLNSNQVSGNGKGAVSGECDADD